MTDDQRKNVKQKIKELKLAGRLLPDSAYTTYFGKPAFHAYGNANTKPTVGGLSYGQYLRTHSINPHSGDNKPEYIQVYAHAMLEPNLYKGKAKSKSPRKSEKDFDGASKTNRFVRKPCPPRQPVPKRPLTGAQLDEQKKRNPITSDKLNGKHNVPIIKPQIKPDYEIE